MDEWVRINPGHYMRDHRNQEVIKAGINKWTLSDMYGEDKTFTSLKKAKEYADSL